MWLIISDTHDNLHNIDKFLEEARKRDVTHIFHCGDIVSPFSLNKFLKFKAEFYGVFGNNDGEILLLSQRSSGRIVKGPIEFLVGERRIAMMHEPFALDALLQSQHYDFIFYGHTHKTDIKEVGKCLLINPGDGSGYIAEKASVVFLEPCSRKVEVYQI